MYLRVNCTLINFLTSATSFYAQHQSPKAKPDGKARRQSPTAKPDGKAQTAKPDGKAQTAKPKQQSPNSNAQTAKPKQQSPTRAFSLFFFLEVQASNVQRTEIKHSRLECPTHCTRVSSVLSKDATHQVSKDAIHFRTAVFTCLLPCLSLGDGDGSA